VVIEELDFSKKKQKLPGTDPRYARMLSSFNCHKIASGIDGACFRAGVGVVKINPAYTSVLDSAIFSASIFTRQQNVLVVAG
jgi:IS605 OrfB family transposase